MFKTEIETSNTNLVHKNVCFYCGKRFIYIYFLKQHIKMVHEGRKDFNCEKCNKSFSTAQNLNKHIHCVHEGRKDFICGKCEKSFATASSLKTHNHRVHEGNGNKDYNNM